MPSRPALVVMAGLLLAGCTSTAARQATASPKQVTTPPSSSTVRSSTTSAPSSSASRPARPTRTHRPSPTPTARRGIALPLHYRTAQARQVITVVAHAEYDTQGTVQAWRRVAGGWRRVGPAVPAYLGSDGMTPYPSESRSAAPMGSFTLTRAFGRLADPGTALPYRQTTPADWWVSEAGTDYNTEQHCSYGCPFTQGNPNEHLYYEVPYYDYAVVIDYNTRNSPTGVQQGAGSAFFLHVAVGAPTAGCVSIPEPDLVSLLRWLDPAAQPRILIGVESNPR